jgi:phospholipase C
VVIAYDDDALNGPGQCTGTPAGGRTAMLDGYQDRCGYGPRLPLLVLSPYARSNTVDHAVTDQTSILRSSTRRRAPRCTDSRRG